MVAYTDARSLPGPQAPCHWQHATGPTAIHARCPIWNALQNAGTAGDGHPADAKVRPFAWAQDPPPGFGLNRLCDAGAARDGRPAHAVRPLSVAVCPCQI